MEADFSICTSNWAFGFLLTLPEKLLSSMEYGTHDIHLKKDTFRPAEY